MLVETLNRMEHHTYIFTRTPDSFELPPLNVYWV